MYTMKDVCRKTGMTYETLKFYCNQGLVPNVKRDAQNHRVFDDRDVAWLEGLTCLKKCGMGIQEMKQYMQLCMEGQSSIPERKAILAQKYVQLQEKMTELQASLDYIDHKQAFYDDVLAGRTKYHSNLISVDDNG